MGRQGCRGSPTPCVGQHCYSSMVGEAWWEMPRKEWTESWKNWRQLNLATWRLLVRRPDFREDLMDLWRLKSLFYQAIEERSNYLAKLHTERLKNPHTKRPKNYQSRSKRLRQKEETADKIAMNKSAEIIRKWGLFNFPSALSEDTLNVLDDCFDGDQLSVEKLENVYNPKFMYERIQFTDDEEDVRKLTFDAILPFPVSEIGSPPGGHEDRANKIYKPVWINLTMNFDLLMATFERQLRLWWRFHGSRSSERGRPKDLNFQLQVFDAVQKGKPDSTPKPFWAVARSLRKPVSTVREAYYAACRKIGVDVAPVNRRSKRAIVASDPKRAIVDPGPIDECTDPKCRVAKTDKDFCQKHRDWIDQDYGSQRDLLQNPEFFDTQIASASPFILH